MVPRRLLFGLLLFLGLVTGSVAIVRRTSQEVPRPYNCLLVYDDMLVQLNTHLTRHTWPKYPSPDGRYVAGRVDGANAHDVFIEEIASGKRVFILRNMLYIHWITWTPDSRFVFILAEDHQHQFHLTRFTQNGGPAGERVLDYAVREDGFSPNGEYLAVFTRDPGMLGFYSTRDFPHPVIEHPANVARGYRVESWSNEGSRVAFASQDRLVVIDLPTGMVYQAPLGQLNGYDLYVRWAADDRRVVAFNTGLDRLSLFELSETQGEPIALLPVGSQPVSPGTLRNSYWGNGDAQLFYFTANTVNETTIYELWRYDVQTQRTTLVDTGLRGYWLDHDILVTLRDNGILEFRARDGSNPRTAHVFQPDDIMKHAASQCSWTPQSWPRPFLRCAVEYYKNPLLFDETGSRVWPTDISPERIAPSYIPDKWVISLTRSDDAEIAGEMLDLETLQSYELPAMMLDTIPDSAFQNTIGFDFGSQSPAPDGKSWLVTFNAALYRFWPADDRWEMIVPNSVRGLGPWSPDGKRYAFFVMENGTPSYYNPGHLIVRETDGTQQWDLGRFYRDWQGLRWFRCGDVLAPLRDRLAAQTP